MRKNTTLRKTIQTSLIIAMALVLRQFSYMVPFGGGGGMRISPAIFISRLPAVMFGPLYGGITSGVIDILGMIIRPEGAWIPPLTISAIAGGVIAGFMWRLVKGADTKLMRRVILIVFAALGILGVSCHVSVLFFEGSAIGRYLSSLKKISFWTVGFEVAAAIGFLVLIIDYIINKKSGGAHGDLFIRLFAALFVSNILITTVNTFILMTFIPAVGASGFWVFYVPRFAEEVIATILQCFVMSYLIKLYNNTVKNG